MFTERFNRLLTEVCHTTTVEFAQLGGYDRSYITHLRNGNRIPTPGYQAAERLADAICACAEKKGSTQSLRGCVGAPDDADGETLSAAVNAWLMEGHAPAPRKPRRGKTARKTGGRQKRSFAAKLVSAMELTDISNQRLARELNVDASVISKYRSGLRVPRIDHPLIREISDLLVLRTYSLDRVAGLGRLIGADLEELTDKAETARRLEAWLRDFSAIDTSLIEDFLDDLDNFSPDTPLPLLPPAEAAGDAANDTAAEYRGIDGLRRAVLRFLYAAIRDERRELLLYSDQNIGWMTMDRDFMVRWTSLMSAYVRGGGRVRIIHDVDRGLEEMLTAIRSWLPLYMSGEIEGWYCTRRGGERFSCTLFLAPEGACISADYVAGQERNARYRYDTEAAELAYYHQYYDDLFADCRLLLRREPAGLDTRSALLRRATDAHLVGSTLSLATMPEPLLERILSRAALPDKLRRQIEAERAENASLLAQKLADGSILHECAPSADAAALAAGQVRVDSALAALSYTPEEYAEHLDAVRALAAEYRNYKFCLLAEPPFRNIRFAAAEQMAVIDGLFDRPIVFRTTHPLLCRAFVNLAARLKRQNAPATPAQASDDTEGGF